jgi:hypothetical protein
LFAAIFNFVFPAVLYSALVSLLFHTDFYREGDGRGWLLGVPAAIADGRAFRSKSSVAKPPSGLSTPIANPKQPPTLTLYLSRPFLTAMGGCFYVIQNGSTFKIVTRLPVMHTLIT